MKRWTSGTIWCAPLPSDQIHLRRGDRYRRCHLRDFDVEGAGSCLTGRVLVRGRLVRIAAFRRGRYGGPLTEAEATLIQEVARSEVQAAFAGLRIRFSEDRNAFYRVRVVQEFGPGIRGAAGATRVLAPLGGNGSVNFLMLASQAVSHAPDGADRATVVQAIGRGIGRAAVHEFLHQLLPRLNVHDSKDDRSYEFVYSSRPAQYYGDMRWDIAWPALVETFGDVQKHQNAR